VNTTYHRTVRSPSTRQETQTKLGGVILRTALSDVGQDTSVHNYLKAISLGHPLGDDTMMGTISTIQHAQSTKTKQRANSRRISRKPPLQRNQLQNRSMSAVSTRVRLFHPSHHCVECIVYTWDYHSSMSIWSGLRVQPILADEVQTFKALIVVHKVLQEGHPVVRLRHDSVSILDRHHIDPERSTKSDRLVGNLRPYNRS
jgi:hypothetical protein